MNKTNIILGIALVIAVAAVSFRVYTTTPEYLAEQQLKNAILLIESGSFDEGLSELSAVVATDTNAAKKALGELSAMAGQQRVDTVTPSNQVKLFELLHTLASNRHIFKKQLQDQIEKLSTNEPLEAGALTLILADNTEDAQAAEDMRVDVYQSWQPLEAEISKQKSYAVKFALLDEWQNECAKCEVMLSPYKSELGSSEAARVLGQLYVREGNITEAFELLEPYVKNNIQTYRQAEQSYNAALDAVWDETIEYLDSGSGPQSFYDAYDKADEAGQQTLVQEVYANRRDRSPLVQQSLDAYRHAAAVVPVALDLGIVRLNRALAMSNPEEQKQELEQAETIFLSVRGAASDTDDYQLYLAQVYYWLGKQEEGEQLFHALIEKYDRSDAVLGAVSNILRDLGAGEKATEYLKEAYEKADKNTKMQYAHRLHVLMTENDDRIYWLERSDQSSAYVKADLYSTKADKAYSDNDYDTAMALYRKAAEAYEAIPEGTTNYNNIALIYQSIYGISHKIEDFDKVLLYMDKAVELSPDDSIVLSNASSIYLSRIYLDVLSREFDFDVFEYGPSLSLIKYLYQNDAEKLALIRDIKSNKHFDKTVEYIKKSILLAPKSAANSRSAFEIFSFLRMDEEVKLLAARAESIKVETDKAQKQLADYRQGLTDAEQLSDLDKAIKWNEKQLPKLGKKSLAIERLVVQDSLNQRRLSQWVYGKNVDVNKILRSAEAIMTSRPSSATKRTYDLALMAAIVEESKAKSQKFSDFYDTYHRIYGAETSVSMAALIDKDYQKLLLEMKPMKALLKLTESGLDLYSAEPSASEWLVLKLYDSPRLEAATKRYRESDMPPVYVSLHKHTSADTESILISEMLHNLILGNADHAKAIVKQGISDGLVIPPELVDSLI